MKADISKFFSQFKKEHKYTYDDLVAITGLSESQVYRVLKKDCKGVSLEVLIRVLLKMGYMVGLELNEGKPK